jgi:hypothetical protein
MRASQVVLEPPIALTHPRGDFQGYDVLKAYIKCYKMSHVKEILGNLKMLLKNC